VISLPHVSGLIYVIAFLMRVGGEGLHLVGGFAGEAAERFGAVL
jgi:hypothetical protein